MISARSSGVTSRANAEPFFEAGHRLMQQHAETIGSAKPLLARALQQVGFERRVDDVVTTASDGKSRQIDVERSAVRPCRAWSYSQVIHNLSTYRTALPVEDGDAAGPKIAASASARSRVRLDKANFPKSRGRAGRE